MRSWNTWTLASKTRPNRWLSFFSSILFFYNFYNFFIFFIVFFKFSCLLCFFFIIFMFIFFFSYFSTTTTTGSLLRPPLHHHQNWMQSCHMAGRTFLSTAFFFFFQSITFVFSILYPIFTISYFYKFNETFEIILNF